MLAKACKVHNVQDTSKKRKLNLASASLTPKLRSTLFISLHIVYISSHHSRGVDHMLTKENNSSFFLDCAVISGFCIKNYTK
jgi:hypothetical protein